MRARPGPARGTFPTLAQTSDPELGARPGRMQLGQPLDQTHQRAPRSGRSRSCGGRLPTLQSTMHLYPVDGAAHDVDPRETAFSYRDARWAEVIVGVDPDPANADTIRSWTVDYWEALHPYSAGGAYVNFLMDEGQERVRATYRDNYARLVAVKERYDPTNLFRVNQNIRPGGSVERA